MPELPEVEAARRLVQEHCLGKIVKAIVADDDKVIEGVEPRELEKILQGATVVAAHRKGKHTWLELDGDRPALLFHFGMTGAMEVEGVKSTKYVNAVKDEEGVWPPKYWKVQLEIAGGVKLAFSDSRRFARVRVLADPENNEPISALGFDILKGMPSLPELQDLLKKQKRGMKALLLDQAFSAGVGNWVADEVLFQAGIHPDEKASALSDEQVAALHVKLHEVAEVAVEAGADAANYPPDWLFHHRWDGHKKSAADAKVGGNPVEYIKSAGRSTAIVPAVQKLSEASARKAKRKPEGAREQKPRSKSKKKKSKAGEDDDEEDEDEEEAEEDAAGDNDDADEDFEEARHQSKKPKNARTDQKAASTKEAIEDEGAAQDHTAATKSKPGKSEIKGKRKAAGKSTLASKTGPKSNKEKK